MIKCLADIPRFISSCLAAVVFSFLVVGCSFEKNFLMAAVFLIIDAYYIYSITVRGAIILIDKERLVRRVMGRKTLEFCWSTIAEVGLVNNRYIYFSTIAMDDEARAEMCFHWPPKDKIYLSSSKKRMAKVRRFWGERGMDIIEYRNKKIKLL